VPTVVTTAGDLDRLALAVIELTHLLLIDHEIDERSTEGPSDSISWPCIKIMIKASVSSCYRCD
jgi:hypothetical protein